jgi:BMFP domain-containing protein YqiC
MKNTAGIFEDLTRLASGVAGTALEGRRELERFCQAQFEKLAGRMQVVSREEFEVVRAMAQAAREENAQLKARLEKLEGSKTDKTLDDFIP